jgi:alcohol dehydrogenase class IV
MRFEFSTASKIVFECGAVRKIPALCSGLGKNIVIIAGGSIIKSGDIEKIADGLKESGIKSVVYRCEPGEPTIESVDKAVAACREATTDALIGVGGGSAMDTAKAVAGVAPNGGSIRDYLEGVGTSKIIKDPLPYIAVPTTSGTGSEVTKNAVITSRSEKFKKSIRDDRLFARAAVIDPELTVPATKSVTASSGMDAICQLVESFIAKQANSFCDAMSLYNIPRAIKALKRAYDDGGDIGAREDMSLAAMVSGICLANAGLGAAHGIGAGLGALLGTPHGTACGMLLPHVIRYNAKRGVVKYATIADNLFDTSYSDREKASLLLADAIEELCSYLEMPLKLGELGATVPMADDLAKASMGSSMSKNPVDISESECRDFILSII